MTMPDRDRWKRLSPLLDELLDLDAGRRRTRLAELRTQDAALADELATLLADANRAEASNFLVGDVQGDSAPSQTLVGRQVGPYIIEAPLGQGGTGSVWRARRADGRFEGSVAVKLLHLSLIGRTGALRFEREGAILARLTHPHIARLLDAGVTPDGQPYLVLELVEGERIDRHCDARRLGVEQRLALFDDVLAAVAHAHSHLVIHRDIKPTNILVGADGTVKLLDFGIAKLLEDESEGVTLTAEGQRALTLEYAAPEQMQGAPVTTATDVYALGVLLYQLLTGRHPTAPDTASSAEVIRTTLGSDPMRLAAALNPSPADGDEALSGVAADRDTPLPRLRRQLRGDLENIVARMLRKSAAQRYQTVAALAEDLQRHLAHEPVSARPDSLAYRCAKFARRHRSMVVAGLLVVLAVAAGLAGTATQALRAQHERDNALRRLSYAKSNNEFIAFLLQEGPNKPLTTSELLARAETILDKRFADQPVQRAHLRVQIAALYARATYFQKAQALLLQARADARDMSDVSLQAGIECFLAYLHVVNGSADSTQPGFDGAADIDRLLLSECLRTGAKAADRAGGARATTLADAQAALDTPGVPRTGTLYRNVGVLPFRAGQALGSLEASQQALDIARGLGGAGPGLDAGDARRLIELGRSRETVGAKDGGDTRIAPDFVVLGAHAWCPANDLVRCAELLASARSELAAILPAGHSMFGTLEMTQAQLALARGDLPQARAGLARAVATFGAASDRNRIGIRALTLLARTEVRLGELDAAEAHAVLAVAQARAAMAGFAQSEWLGDALLVQGMVQQGRGQAAAAQASWRAALVELQATVGDAAAATVETRRLLAGP